MGHVVDVIMVVGAGALIFFGLMVVRPDEIIGLVGLSIAGLAVGVIVVGRLSAQLKVVTVAVALGLSGLLRIVDGVRERRERRGDLVT